MAHTECHHCNAHFHESSGDKAFADWEGHMKSHHTGEWKRMTPRQIGMMEWKMKMELRQQMTELL